MQGARQHAQRRDRKGALGPRGLAMASGVRESSALAHARGSLSRDGEGDSINGGFAY